MAGERALGREDRAAGVEPDRPQAGLRGDDRRREAPATGSHTTGRDSSAAPARPHSLGESRADTRIGCDRPPTVASIVQPAARSEPTAPIASNSQARAAAGLVAVASSSAVTENNGPGARAGRARADAGAALDGRLRNK